MQNQPPLGHIVRSGTTTDVVKVSAQRRWRFDGPSIARPAGLTLPPSPPNRDRAS